MKEPKKEPKKEVKSESINAKGEIKIINSKIKDGLCYTIKIINNNGEIIMNESKEGIKDTTKDKLLNELLINIHKNNKDIIIDIKINYKDYIKKFNLMVSKYNELIIQANKFDKKNNDIGLIKLHKEIADNAELLEIKDYIKLID